MRLHNLSNHPEPVGTPTPLGPGPGCSTYRKGRTSNWSCERVTLNGGYTVELLNFAELFCPLLCFSCCCYEEKMTEQPETNALMVIGLMLARAFTQFLSSPSPPLPPSSRPTPRQASSGRGRPSRRRIPATLRFQVWESFCGSSFIGECFACGSKIHFRNFHCGHIIPVCKGFHHVG